MAARAQDGTAIKVAINMTPVVNDQASSLPMEAALHSWNSLSSQGSRNRNVNLLIFGRGMGAVVVGSGPRSVYKKAVKGERSMSSSCTGLCGLVVLVLVVVAVAVAWRSSYTGLKSNEVTTETNSRSCWV